MSLTTSLWRVNGTVSKPVVATPMDLEERLEDLIVADADLLGPDQLLIVDRQVTTSHGKYLDLLAIDEEQTLHAIELKKDRTPRDVVAQALDYGWWVRELTLDDVRAIWADRKIAADGDERSFDAAYYDRFKTDLDVETFNTDHRLTVVAAALDPATPRIIEYLADDYAVPINAVLFSHFADDGREYLTRTWMRPPSEDDTKATPKRSHRGQKPKWNGRDLLMPLGRREDPTPEARWYHGLRYGFVGAGGGAAYWKFLRSFEPGMRVFGYVGGAGYIGIGEVTGPMVPLEDLMVTSPNGDSVRFVDTPDCPQHFRDRIAAGDADQSEYAVPVDWLATTDLDHAVWETGLYTNQVPGRLKDEQTIRHVEQALGLTDTPDGFAQMNPGERLAEAPAPVRELFDQLEKRCLEAGMKRQDRKWWVTFAGPPGSLSVVIRNAKLLVYTNRDPAELAARGADVRDVTGIGHHGTGDTELTLRELSDLDHLETLLA